jgi:hypothetical protein
MPGTIYNKQSEIKPQRGRIVVAAAARRTGFMQLYIYDWVGKLNK